MINKYHGFSFQKYNYIYFIIFLLECLKIHFSPLMCLYSHTSSLLVSQFDKEVMIAIHSDMMFIIIIINQYYPNSPEYMS